jgi:mono/diheme cytochrome c family protein
MGCFPATTINAELEDEEPAPSPDGVALYAANCESCHGVLAESVKIGVTAEEIQDAIVSNTGNMGSEELMALTPEEIAAIAEALQE